MDDENTPEPTTDDLWDDHWDCQLAYDREND